jgi:para-nitrobenzyl esterase
MGGDGKQGSGPGRRAVVEGALATAAALCALPVGGASAQTPGGGPVATTRFGRIRGYEDGPIKVFKGVPYGADTGGANRWLPAKPPKPWPGVRHATEQGPMCPQMFGAPMAEETALLQRGPMTEDCLNLDIWTPAVGPASGARPVMVWYHGGGFSGGSGGAASYDGRNLCEKQDVVLVTVTHRLNIFGFFYIGEIYGPTYADSGNVGIMDCVAALRWVHDNISHFGGDPDNVTIFGQSGGGAKVSTMMGMPGAKGLFQRAIAESGASVRVGTKASAAAQAKAVIDALGVKSLAELQAIPPERLIQAAGPMGMGRLQPSPIVDGRVIPANPFDPVASPISRDVPFMCGTTKTESVFFPNTPLDPIDDADLHDRLKKTFNGIPDADVDRVVQAVRTDEPGASNTFVFQLVTSLNFGAGVITEAERKADQGGAPVFVYYFTHAVSARGGKLGAPHTAEIPYAFDSLAYAKPLVGPVTASEQHLADEVSACWTSFARHGDPNNSQIPHWAPYNTTDRPTMVIGDPFRLEDDPMGHTRALLEEIKAKYPPFGPFGPPPLVRPSS